MSHPQKTIEERLIALERELDAQRATDRKHSNTHRGLADSVREAERVARETASNVKETTNAELLSAFTILSSAIGEMKVASEQQHADDARAREAIQQDLAASREEVRQLRAAVKPIEAMTVHTASASLEAKRAKLVAESVGDDTTAILAGQQSQRRMAWARMLLTSAIVPIVFKLLEHC